MIHLYELGMTAGRSPAESPIFFALARVQEEVTEYTE